MDGRLSREGWEAKLRRMGSFRERNGWISREGRVTRSRGMGG
jgi:hypothetical protein